jgi:acetylornithine deacetylase
MDRSLAHLSDTELDAHIDREAATAFAFLERLVGEASVLGAERGALAVAAAELERLGFALEWLPIPATIGEDPSAGVPQAVAGPRDVMVARRAGRDGATARSLLLNGHLDVVPSGDPALWSHAPFVATTVDGWMTGRGAGDMKSGWCMAVLALSALLAVGDPAGDLTVVGVIEEECTGNGTLASVRAGVLADAVVLPEPTDLTLMTAGVGVLWLDVEVHGTQGHALAAPSGVSALESAWAVVGALRAIAEELNAGQDASRYHINIGTFNAGEWRSTVPGSAVLGVRVGFPEDWAPQDAQRWVTERLTAALAEHPWLGEHPPTVTPSGFRARGYELAEGSALASAVSDAHRKVHGQEPETVATNGTTDARFYLNEGGVPALCYGPRTRGMHGFDEAVELDSIVAGARVLARFMAAWLETPKAEDA